MIITKETPVEDIIKGYPSLLKVFIEFGLPCLVCGEAFWGTIAELARQHGANMDELIKKLNQRKNYDEKL